MQLGQARERTSQCDAYGKRATLLVVLLTIAFAVPAANAGGGPENVFLVVNKRSWASRTIANHYVALRKIPTNNVFFIDWSGNVERISMAQFRKWILQPILAEIDKRRLGEQIDYIVYSSDFPYEIDFSNEVSTKAKFMSGSITSLTYLYELIESEKTNSLGSRNNFYASTSTLRGSSHGFKNNDAWQTMGRRSTNGDGTNYFLSAMLGYTSGRGNSVEEVINYLTRAAKVDGTQPAGTVYFMANQDIRSTTRSPLFAEVVRAINSQGGRAEILQGVLPTGRVDVMGATVGKSVYRVAQDKCEFLPGAIFDNLTSFGGVLREGAGQTPLTEALRHGAAGATGTIIEPYALRPKFPHPSLHLHYLRGCSLAESVYQSVTSPYQLLLVGDPLCQPYAKIPVVELEGIPSDNVVKGEVTIRPSVSSPADAKVLRYELYVDGIRRGTCRGEGILNFDSATMPDGVHEIRIVAVLDDDISTQGRKIINMNVNNRGNTIRTRLASPPSVSLNGQVSLDVESKNAKKGIVIFSQRELIGRAAKKRATINVSPLRIGMGPHRLLAVGLGDSNLENVFSAPVDILVQPGILFPAQPMPVGIDARPGIEIRMPDGVKKSVKSTKGNRWLTDLGVQDGQPFSVRSRFSVPRTGVYQFQMQFKGDFDLQVDGKTLFAQRAVPSSARFEIPIHLQQGSHKLAINAKLSPPRLMLRFGDKGTQNLAGPRFQH